jgi:hypothetical protein
MKLSEIAIIKVQEADEPAGGKGPVEIADIVKDHDAKYAKKYLASLWGTPRLTFNGEPIFDEVYEKIDSAVSSFVDQGHEVDISIPVEDPDDLGMDELNYRDTIEDQQEVYLGYNPTDEKLYVGIDAWLREEDFNEAWDREFENETGESYDEENDDHAAMFHSAWENYKNMGFYGILFEIDSNFDVEPVIEENGGFYKGIYRSPRFKELGLVDLRLD